MTFQEFQATRQWSADIGAHINDSHWEDDSVPPQGWIYLDYLYIEVVANHWPEDARNQGNWYLILGREEYISNDLEMLERTLFNWAVDEGYSI